MRAEEVLITVACGLKLKDSVDSDEQQFIYPQVVKNSFVLFVQVLLIFIRWS